MALNPNKLQFLINQLSKAGFSSFPGTVAQIFSYLDSEIKDNPIFDKYEKERSKWDNWPVINDNSYPSWTLPGNFEDAKSLAYSIYRRISISETNFASSFGYYLFSESVVSENVDKLNETFIGYFAEALNDIANANPEYDNEKPKAAQGNTVFLVHGHDIALKSELLLLLQKAGVNSFVLHEQPDKGRTIIDKLIEETQPAGYAIGLLTPDDLTDVGTNRARQNVILEIGYFIGKIGKERVRMVVKGDLEIPSDLHGILYEKYDDNGAWKIKLLKEIQAVGIYVDIQSVVNSF